MLSKARYFSIIFIIVIVFSCNNRNNSESDSQISRTHRRAKNDAQPLDQKYSADQLDNTKGLSNSSVNCIFQDSENLIWVGTWDGLNRYDGNSFKIFRPEPDNKNSLSNQVVLKVGEDSNGNIWILTLHGINRYDKYTDTFYRYYFSGDNKTPLSESQFNMALDASNHIYCAVKGWGIGYYDGNVFKRFKGDFFPDKTVKKIEFLNKAEMLVLFDDNELYSLHISTAVNGEKKISKIEQIQSKVKTFEVMPKGTICSIFTTGKAGYFKKNNHQYNEILGGKTIDNITGRVEGGLILSTRNGYAAVDRNGNEMTMPWLKYIWGQKITTLLQGNENILWTGTDGDGIFKLHPQKKSFSLISKSQIPELEGGIVRSFLKADNNSFFVGTKGKGLFRLSGDFYLSQDPSLAFTKYNEDNSPVNNSVYALSKGNDELVFIGTDGQGLTIYDLKNSKITGWNEILGSVSCDYFRSVYTIYQDPAGCIWLGTNGYGMISCKIVRDGGRLKITDFKRYAADASGMKKLSSNVIFSIIPEGNDKLWIGTRLGGLNLFDKRNGSFTVYKNIPGDPGSLSSNDILCIVKGVDNKLWVGTSYGLNLLQKIRDNGDAVFKNFTVKDGLPNNTIHGIVPLSASNLWVSTNFGLSNVSLNPDKFTNYSKNEGLQNNEFADGAYYYDNLSGYIFMGGIKGLNYFLPQKIKESVDIPNLFIDRISGQNQSIPYAQGMVISPYAASYTSINLKHDQNFFDIHLTALTFTNNEKCSYSYQLKGFDKYWNTIGSRKIISFTNVPRGNYELWLKWSNADGVWSKAVHAVNITVKPVWWQSNIALLAYTLLAVLFILFVRSYYLKRKSLQQNLLFIKHEEELHENRLTFFTNIAHEFLTPLTLIAGPAQKMSETGDLNGRNRKFISMIQRNTSRLLFLTQQLLEFRKAEYEYLDVTVKKFDLVNLIEQIAELFDDWALDKNINYTIDVPSELHGWFDKDKLEKIVFNLMSNAFKYTPVNGKITITCRLEKREEMARLNFTISNTGKGIPKDKLDSLFDRFFLSDTNQTSDTEHFRTGIGLAFIKKLVTVLRGEILVKSIPDEETSFTILIPCNESSFSEKEIDKENAAVLVSQHLKNILTATSEEETEEIPAKISAFEVVEAAKKSVLIVEDEKEIHLFLNDLLSEKYKIISAYNGIEALETMETELPDIIVSDVMMPQMDGVELCAKVKTDVRSCHIPFIMLTAKNSVLHRIEGLEKGANSYIPKPFYPEHLLIRIQKLLEEKELILQHFTQDTVINDTKDIPVNNTDRAFIRNVIDIIRLNIENENLNSALIEKELGISNSTLYRKIKEVFGLSPGDLIRTIKLKYSAELLRKDKFTVSEVCYKSGFNNRSYFYREFKKVYDTTPKNYQLQYRVKSVHFSNN